MEVSVRTDVQMFRLPLCIPSITVAKFRLWTRLFLGTFMSQQQTHTNSLWHYRNGKTSVYISTADMFGVPG
jgi:hypothetical protein